MLPAMCSLKKNTTRPPHYDSHITHSTEQWTTVHSHKLQWRYLVSKFGHRLILQDF